MKIIECVISADGETVDIKTTGFQGDACKAATRQLEQDLGLTLSDTPTAEALKPPDTGLKVGTR